jgi:hypothetical protein
MKALAISICMVITLAAGCSSGGKKSASGTVATTTTRVSARCHTPELEATGPIDGGAATGHQISYWQLKNISSRTCQLLGYPGVTLADASGNPITTKDQRGSGFITSGKPPGVVKMAPGATAVFGLETHSCIATGDHEGPKSASIQIIPPDETDHLTVKTGMALCQDQTLIVSPVRANKDEVTT